MSSSGNKLYPPILNDTLPAFYEENGTAIITVPFSINRAVSVSDIGQFRLKIKTVQNNVLLTVLEVKNLTDISSMLSKGVAKFSWFKTDDSFAKIAIGQYLKVQMAFTDTSGTIVGYFSNVSVIKYTAKPTVHIINAESSQPNSTELYKTNYIGAYEPLYDTSERPYSYCFNLYNKNREIVESSGWLLHNTSITYLIQESLSLNSTIDTYSFSTSLIPQEQYYIEYTVRTINNLEISSPLYSCMDLPVEQSNLEVALNGENNFDNAYIKLNFISISSHALSGPLPNPTSFLIQRSDYYHNYQNWETIQKLYFESYEQLFEWVFKDFTIEQGLCYKYCFRIYNGEGIATARSLANNGNYILADFEDMFLYDGKKQLRIRYNPKITSFKTTQLEQKIETIGSQFPFIFKNGIVKYKEFPISGLLSYSVDIEELFANQEQELNVIKLEEIFREGTPNWYGSGYYTLKDGKYIPDYQAVKESLPSGVSNSQFDSLNIQAERIFKLKALDWLNNGEVKLFKSPTEGNYLVKLMNISMTPEDKLSRLLHTITAQAYEVAEYNIANLQISNILSISDFEIDKLYSKTLNIYNQVISKVDNTTSLNTSILINNGNRIVNNLIIEPAESTSDYGFYLRIGGDDVSKRTYIQKSRVLNLSMANAILPDLYFNAYDNLELINMLVGDSDHAFTTSSKYNSKININGISKTLKQAIHELIGDLTITYSYYTTESLTGSLGNIENIYIENIIETWNGPWSQNFTIAGDIKLEDSGTKREVINFLMLNFYKKPIIDLTYQTLSDESAAYYNSEFISTPASSWDELAIYRISNPSTMRLTLDTAVNTNKIYYTKTTSENLVYFTPVKSPKTANLDSYYESTENTVYRIGSGSHDIINLNTTITLKLEDGTSVSMVKPPFILQTSNMYQQISIGNGIYLQAAYQQRVIKYTD